MYIRRIKIRSYEKGLLFKDKEFAKILDEGTYWQIDPLWKTRVYVVSMRDPWLNHPDIDLIISSGKLNDDAQVIELNDSQRGLVWVDNRFDKILGPGQFVLWGGFRKVRVELADINEVKFTHKEIQAITNSHSSEDELIIHRIEKGFAGVLILDGKTKDVLGSGQHVFWRKAADVKLLLVDMRESTLDVSGQEIISRDKVSLRLNGLATYKVIDPLKATTEVENYVQSLYRETQLALRAIVGTQDLDSLLSDKESLADAVKEILAKKALAIGMQVTGFGIRDIILPGDMKELLNKVVESKKAAEANLISRREETAAMRSQANTAKILENSPTLMRLKELELLEKVASSSNLNIVCGESPLTDSIVKLI